MNTTKVERQMDKFESYLMVDEGLCKVTASGYCRTMNIALRRMKKFVPEYTDAKEYMAWMYNKNYSYSYTRNTLIAIEHYSRFKNPEDPKKVIKMKPREKPKRIIKDVLTEAEGARMLLASKNIRVKAMICLLAYSGLRAQELCNLRVEDVDLGANQLIVRSGKNFQDGVVNISADCTRVLIDYLRAYPREKDGYLFTTLVRNVKLATGDLRKWVRITAKQAMIDRRVHPHLFRHSLATNLLNRGASLMMIQQQLRHRQIESTMIYVISRPLRNKTEYEYFKPCYM